MVFGGIGTILTAGYLLWTVQRVNMGTLSEERWKETLLGRHDDRMGGLGAAAGRDRGARPGPGLVFGMTNDAVTRWLGEDVRSPMSCRTRPIDFHAIAPELILAGTAFVVLFVDLVPAAGAQVDRDADRVRRDARPRWSRR